MQTTVQKWGNSQGIRIPKGLLEAMGIKENDIVELSRQKDDIIIKKVTKRQDKLNLADIFKGYEGEYVPEDFDWGSPVGKEVW